MIHTALNQWSAVLLNVCMTGRSVAWQNHQSSLRKRNICHQFLFLTVITPPLYCRKQDNWYWLKLSWCDDCGISGWKSSEQQGIGADFRSDTTLRSHAAKSTLVKREDLFNRGWKNTREMRFLYIKGCTRIVYIYAKTNKTFCAWQHSFNCSSTGVIKYKASFWPSDFMESRNRTLACFFWKGNLFEQKALFLMDDGIVVIQILTAGYPLGNELVLALIFIYFKRFYPIFYLSLFCLSSFSF